jgi:hypothetical protein
MVVVVVVMVFCVPPETFSFFDLDSNNPPPIVGRSLKSYAGIARSVSVG